MAPVTELLTIVSAGGDVGMMVAAALLANQHRRICRIEKKLYLWGE